MYLNFPYLVTLSFIQFWEILLSNKLSIFAYEKKKKKKGYVLMSAKQVAVVLFFSKKPLMFFFLNKK